MEIDKGDFVAIMGASGSGKSTLLNLISTIDKPTHAPDRKWKPSHKPLFVFHHLKFGKDIYLLTYL